MKINKATLCFICIVIFLVQPIIYNYIGVFKYFDEIIVLFLFAWYVLKGKIEKKERMLLAGLALLIVVGLIGNVRSHSGQPLAAIMQDILSNAKLILLAVAAKGIVLTDQQKIKLTNRLSFVIRLLFVIIFLCFILSLFFDMGMTSKERYGIASYKFLFDNAGTLNTYFYYYMIVFSITLFKNGKLRKNSIVFLVMALIPWIMTLRTRAIAFELLYVILFVYIFFIRKKNKEYKIRLYHILLIIVAFISLGWDSIYKYFIERDSVSRYQLLRKSFVLARDFFPIGAGFGTFGTQASRDYYSFIYYKYGMSNIYGLNPAHPAFVTDQYWFGILGQFGVIGVALIAFMVFEIYTDIWNKSKSSKNMQLAAITLFYTSIFSSFTAGSFINATILPSVWLFYLLGNDSNSNNSG